MAEADLSKIVSLIMENPHIIDEIKKLAENAEDAGEPTGGVSEAPIMKREEETEETSAPPTNQRRSKRRRELLSALKPYVSGERGQAIESIMTIADIIDTMGRK